MSGKRTAASAGLAAPSSDLKKRELDVSEISETSNGATASVHGVCVALSPVKVCKNKPSCKYFDGVLSDGKKTVRVLSFDPKMRCHFESSKASGSPVLLKDCIIQESKFGGPSSSLSLSSRAKLR